MAVTITGTPVRTVNSIDSDVSASRTQIPFTFTSDISNDHDNYRVNVEVFDFDGDVSILGFSLKYKPRPDGSLFVDLHQLIQEYQENAGKENAESVQYYINVWETYDNSPAPTVQRRPLVGAYQAIYAQRQIQSEGGANMGEYLLDLTTPAKTLTRFTMPKVWVGWKRTNGTIVDSGLDARVPDAIQMRSEWLTNKKEVISDAVTTPIDKADVSSVNLLIQQATTTGGANVAFYRVNIETVVGQTPVCEPLTYKVAPQCPNPVFIEWLTDKGIFEQHVFSINQNIQLEADDGVYAVRPIDEDIADIQQTKLRVSDSWTQRMILSDDTVAPEDIQALFDIKKSSVVRLLLNRSGSRFVTVVVRNTLADEWTTEDTQVTFTLQIELPDNFDFFEAVDYQAIPLSAHKRNAFTIGFN